MLLPVYLYILALLLAVTFILAVIVYAGGYRSAYNLVMFEQYKKAQAEFSVIRQKIKRHHSDVIKELNGDVDIYLERLQEARREVLKQYGIELDDGGEVVHTSLDVQEQKKKTSDPMKALMEIAGKLNMAEGGDVGLDSIVNDKADKMTQALKSKLKEIAPRES